MPLSEVQPADVEFVLDAVRPQVDRALASGQGDATTYEAMLEALQGGQMKLWAVHDGDNVQAAIVLSAVRHVTGPKLYVEVLAGADMDEWGNEVEAALEECRQRMGVNRPGNSGGSFL